MALTKIPRKKPVTPVVEVEKPAAKAKAAPIKKVAPKKAETAAPKAKPAAKTSPKAKAAKAVEATPEASVALPQAVVAVPMPPAVQEGKPLAKQASSSLPPLVAAILTAIQEGQAVEFIFADAEANAPRTFEPRHLTFDALSQAWFAWGWDRRYNAERHHRVDLLAEVNPVEGVGRAAQGPYAEGTPANQIGGWLGGEPIPVKATLLKQWVFAVKQAPPAFPHFKMEEQGDGQALVSFSATDLRAIARWAMQFGDGIQVLEPARLVDRIKQVGAVWAGRERPMAVAPAPKPASRPESTARSEHGPRHEHASRAEGAHEPRRHEARPPREARPERPEREREEAPKGKAGKVEVIRFDRL